MADVVLHPAVRARLQARLAVVGAQLALTRTGMLHLLRQPDYLTATEANAQREGVSIYEMHRRGVDNLRRTLENEARELRAVLAVSSEHA